MEECGEWAEERIWVEGRCVGVETIEGDEPKVDGERPPC